MTISNHHPETIRYIIGIDPGVKTGIAIKSVKTNKVVEAKAMMIHEAFLYLMEYKDNSFVIMEDARLWSGYSRHEGRENQLAKAQGAGSVKRDCRAWEDYLLQWKFSFTFISPAQKGKKIDHNEMVKLFGYSGSTNQHARDAAMVIRPYNGNYINAILKPSKSKL